MIKDIAGEKFVFLTAIEPTDRSDGHGHKYWRCRCDCGKETVVNSHDLRRYKTKSCGHLRGSPRKRQ